MFVGAVCQWHTFSTDRSGAETLRELPAAEQFAGIGVVI